MDGFNQRVVDNNRENYVVEWLTPFGDTLLSMLDGGGDRLMLSDALETYLKQTQRDHLPVSNKAVLPYLDLNSCTLVYSCTNSYSCCLRKP